MNRETFTGLITKLASNEIFVFGSNPEGRHGSGAAKVARLKFGAKYGQGHGIQGQSYALVTKNLRVGYFDTVTQVKYPKSGLRSVSQEQIIKHIQTLNSYARKNPQKKFMIAYTAQGNNLNGYTSQEMAKMFHQTKPIPRNIIFESEFAKLVYS